MHRSKHSASAAALETALLFSRQLIPGLPTRPQNPNIHSESANRIAVSLHATPLRAAANCAECAVTNVFRGPHRNVDAKTDVSAA